MTRCSLHPHQTYLSSSSLTNRTARPRPRSSMRSGVNRWPAMRTTSTSSSTPPLCPVAAAAAAAAVPAGAGIVEAAVLVNVGPEVMVLACRLKTPFPAAGTLLLLLSCPRCLPMLRMAFDGCCSLWPVGRFSQTAAAGAAQRPRATGAFSQRASSLLLTPLPVMWWCVWCLLVEPIVIFAHRKVWGGCSAILCVRERLRRGGSKRVDR